MPRSTALLRGTATAKVTASDSGSGLAEDPSGSIAISTAAVGPQTITRTATDRAGNSTTRSCTTAVRYRTDGLIGIPEGSTVTALRLGSVALRIALADASGTSVPDADVRVAVAPIIGGTIGTYGPGTPVLGFLSPLDQLLGLGSRDRFIYSSLLRRYTYTLSTLPLSRGQWSVRVTVDDGTQHTFVLRLL